MMFRKILLFCVFFFVGASVRASWEDVTLGITEPVGNAQLVSGLDQNKVLCLLSRCLIHYYNAENETSYSFLRYDSSRHVAQFDNSFVFYSSSSSVEGHYVQIDDLRLAPCFYFSGSNLDSVGDLYIWLFVYSHLRWDNSTVIINSACYKVNGVNFSSSIDVFESLSLERVTSPQNWIYPIYLNVSGQGNTNFSCYLTRNCPQTVNDTTPVYNAQYQQASQYLQLPTHWSVALLLCAAGTTGTNNLSVSWQTIKNRLDNNHVIYYDSNYSTVAWGGSPAVSGPAGYIDMPYSQFNVLTDYDRGGQCDWSEYYRGMDMRNPADDKPSLDSDVESPSEIVVIEPDPVPGQDNLYNMFGEEVQDPNSSLFGSVKTQVDYRVRRILDANQNLNEIKAIINPSGFRTDAPLPRYVISMNSRTSTSTFFGVSLNLPDVVIDFEFLRESPFRDIWTIVRGVLNMSLFVMTVLTIYGMYEKALAWSV